MLKKIFRTRKKEKKKKKKKKKRRRKKKKSALVLEASEKYFESQSLQAKVV